MTIYRYLAVSDDPIARAARRARRSARAFTIPAPRPLARAFLWTFLGARGAFYLAKRLLVCEPLFKAYCTRYGRRLRTGVYVHWVEGRGDIIVGDDVLVDGKVGIAFAARFADRPTLTVGDRTIISHNCQFTVGRGITIGSHCLIAADVRLYDSDGHPTDPADRLAGLPPPETSSRPIAIGDNVWIGTGSIVLKGVTIGAGSVVAAGSVVTRDVPPGVLVAGHPAKVVKHLGGGAP